MLAIDKDHTNAPAQFLLQVEGISYAYKSRGRSIAALAGITFDVWPGETLAVIGESGSGKSTLARILAGLLPASHGQLIFHGDRLGATVGQRPQNFLRQIQIVFQNPDGSLNPRQRVSTIIGRPLQRFYNLQGSALRKCVGDLLENVRLPRHYADRYSSELSGGERQRVAVARALAADPELLICDEITSALDVSVQADLLALLKDIQRRTDVSILFITHDLALARWFADRAIVLLRGVICERSAIPDIYLRPKHSYTASLIDAVPRFGHFGADSARAGSSEKETTVLRPPE